MACLSGSSGLFKTELALKIESQSPVVAGVGLEPTTFGL